MIQLSIEAWVTKVSDMLISVPVIFYSILVVLSMLYVDVSIFGIGLPVILLAAMAMPLLFSPTIKWKFLLRTNPVKYTTLLYLFFSVCFFLALYLSSNLHGDNLVFLTSLAAQAFWFPILFFFAIYDAELLHKSLKFSVRISIIVLGAIWLISVLTTGDIFVLRNGYANISSNPLFFIPAIFDNANLAARTAFILLSISMYYRMTAGTRDDAKHWTFLSLVASAIIFFTLSRAVISGAILLWLFCILGSSSKNGKITKILAFAVILLALVTLVPQVSDRLNEGVDRLSEVSLGFGSESISARDTTIRGRSWAASIQIIRDNAISGIGVSDSLEYMKFYGAVHYKTGEETAIWVHGGFLKIALYAGVLGLGSFAILYIYLCKSFLTGFRANRYKANRQQRDAAILGLAFLLSLIPINIGADSFGSAMTWFTLAFVLSQVCVQITPQRNRKKMSSLSRNFTEKRE